MLFRERLSDKMDEACEVIDHVNLEEDEEDSQASAPVTPINAGQAFNFMGAKVVRKRYIPEYAKYKDAGEKEVVETKTEVMGKDQESGSSITKNAVEKGVVDEGSNIAEGNLLEKTSVSEISEHNSDVEKASEVRGRQDTLLKDTLLDVSKGDTADDDVSLEHGMKGYQKDVVPESGSKDITEGGTSKVYIKRWSKTEGKMSVINNEEDSLDDVFQENVNLSGVEQLATDSQA